MAEELKYGLLWNMMSEVYSLTEISYRKIYGKLFSGLVQQFGASYVNEIEDAIQNSFYKSLKSWKADKIPENKENWLYIVARNELLSHIKRLQKQNSIDFLDQKTEGLCEDLRLKTILFLSKATNVSDKSKVVFILKNVFGLGIKEISNSLFLSEDAIYKSNQRAKKDFISSAKYAEFDAIFANISEKDIALIEEVLYGVFNIGFDSFSGKNNQILNEDLCLDALALVKLLSVKFKKVSTKNLLALFSFHLARLPTKASNKKIASFFEQDRTYWNADLIKLGFYYLEKPKQLDKYYLEALIASRYMSITEFHREDWEEVIGLYKSLLAISNSPVVRLNLCYCLKKAGRIYEAQSLLKIVEKQLPTSYLYLSLVKAEFLKGDKQDEADKIIAEALKSVTQNIRRAHILENMNLAF